MADKKPNDKKDNFSEAEDERTGRDGVREDDERAREATGHHHHGGGRHHHGHSHDHADDGHDDYPFHRHVHGVPVSRADGGSTLTVDHPAVVHPEDQVWGRKELAGTDVQVRGVETARYDYRERWERLRDPENRVIKGGEIPYSGRTEGESSEGAQIWNKHYIKPERGLTQSLTMHCEILAPEGESQDHYHQNEAYMYVLEGEGYEIHDGEKYKWEAGDLVVIHGGCVHQHFSADPDNLCKVLIIKPKALYQFLNLLYQGVIRKSPAEPASDPEWAPPELYYADSMATDGEVVDNRGGDDE